MATLRTNFQRPIIGWYVPSVPGDSGSDSALRRCVGCGRRFVPTGRQRYCSHECYSGTLRVPIEQRFWTKVNKHGPIPAHMRHLGSCWLWTGSLVQRYGQIATVINGKRRPACAHRVSWELTRGAIPDGLSVLHRCDNPPCVRPDHLFLGTSVDNLADARAKGRLIDGLGARKLSDAAYREILAPAERGSGIALARKYGVSKVTISRIRHGRQGSTFHRTESQPPRVRRAERTIEEAQRRHRMVG
jgi:hypothetical protein